MLIRSFGFTFIFLLLSSYVLAQDTLFTQYPNTQQRWEKIFKDDQKIAENVYHENGTAWMTFQYDKDQTEYYKWFHDNGNPFFEAKNIDGKLQGSYRIWYENGQQRSNSGRFRW